MLTKKSKTSETMATQDAFRREAERARQDGLRLSTDPSTLQDASPASRPPAGPSPVHRSDQLSAGQPRTANSSISPVQRGVPNAQPYAKDSPPSSTSELNVKQKTVPAIAWLYDYTGGPEDDDWLHVPGIERKRSTLNCLFGWCNLGGRGLINVGVLMFLSLGLLMLFAGYPVLYHFVFSPADKKLHPTTALAEQTAAAKYLSFPVCFRSSTSTRRKRRANGKTPPTVRATTLCLATSLNKTVEPFGRAMIPSGKLSTFTTGLLATMNGTLLKLSTPLAAS